MTESELPKGWCLASLEEIVEANRKIAYGVLQLGQDIGDGVPLVRVKDIAEGRVAVDGLKRIHPDIAAKYPRTMLRGGEVLLTIVGTIGRTAVVPKSLVGANAARAVAVIPVAPDLEARFVEVALRQSSVREKLTSAAHEVARKTLNLEDVRLATIPIAPIGEQQRIVAKLDELFSDLDAGVAALERAQANLKRYRAAVLKAAVEGRLTEEWREQHPDTEPASELLTRILAERRSKWESEKLADYEAKGRKPPKDWKAKYPAPAELDDAELPELPTGWIWTTLDSVSSITGGITKGQKHGSDVELRDVPYLRVANVQRGFLKLNEIKTILARPADVERLLLKEGDVLFNEGGDRDKLGRGWVWDGQVENCIHQNHVFRARPLVPEIQSRFISHHGNTFGQEWFMRAGTQSVNLASINLTALRRFPVPVPPADEQAAIIELLDEKLPNIEHALELIEKNFARAKRLRQSILKDAFEGKLAEQDASDEPASKLLDRIQRERAVEDAKPKPPRRPKVKGRAKVKNERKPIRDVVENHPDGVSPDTVFAEAGFDSENLNDLDSFYADLSDLVSKRHVEVERPDSASVLIKPRAK
jgi:type I restriction enzyme, S subunit